jgi:hypothetical protein
MAQADAPLHYPWSANVIGLLNGQIHRGEARPILHMHGLVRGDLRSCGDSQRYWIGLRRDSLADHGRFRELCCFWPPAADRVASLLVSGVSIPKSRTRSRPRASSRMSMVSPSTTSRRSPSRRQDRLPRSATRSGLSPPSMLSRPSCSPASSSRVRGSVEFQRHWGRPAATEAAGSRWRRAWFLRCMPACVGLRGP